MSSSAPTPTAVEDPPQPPPSSAPRRGQGESHARTWSAGFLAKLALMALVNAFAVYVLISSYQLKSWGIFAAMLGLIVLADWVYFSKKQIAMKYILPGLAFLLVFQIYTIVYTVYVSFTNYGDGHNSTKDAAISSLLAQNERRVEGSDAYPLAIVQDGDTLGLAILDGDEVLVGSQEQAMSEAPDATVTDGAITEVPGWEVLSYQEVLQYQDEVTALRVPFSEDPEDGSIRTSDARNGYLYTSSLSYDESADTMTDTTTGTVYVANDRGQFESSDGETLNVGWRVNVGIENFTKAFSDPRYSGPFWKILGWTFAQAILSVATTFLLGLFLAVAFNRPMRGQKIYRTLLILPYAIPGFISTLIFAGMLNQSYGFVNEVLLGGADIPWLNDPWMAKLSILIVNLWLGYPYMFLISLGALQSIPTELTEAAKIDGASAFRQWRSITMPLLLIATAPLLISSFAFNFNNFNLVYMLTNGGPSFGDPSVPLGSTDILITMVYNISGIAGNAARDYGLASALSIMIFVIVGVISGIAFRQTRKLEEMN